MKFTDRQSYEILRSHSSLRMTWGKGVNVFSLSKGEGQGEGFITNLRKELINKPSPAFVVFANAQTQLLPLTKREGNKKLKELINLSTYPHINFRKAFTLAEVLITLGIIGVVAAMTIPNLITNYQKHQTETQLVKFYSMMNQTLRMSVAENGDPDGWITPNKSYTYTETVEFLKTYIFPYMKHSGYEACSAKYPSLILKNVACVYMMDGSVITFSIDSNGGDINFWTEKRWLSDSTNFPRHTFKFQMAKVNNSADKVLKSISYIEPYTYNWNGTKEDIKSNPTYGCHRNSKVFNFCTKMIEMNSWKIPSDYPW